MRGSGKEGGVRGRGGVVIHYVVVDGVCESCSFVVVPTGPASRNDNLPLRAHRSHRSRPNSPTSLSLLPFFAHCSSLSLSSLSGQVSVSAAFRGASSGQTRAATALGREVRLGTASLSSGAPGLFIDVEKLDLRKYAKRPGLAMALADYLLHVEHNPRKALELCAEATERANFESWWWKARLGKCYYKLGLYREAEKQLRSSLKNEEVRGVRG